MIFIAGKTYYCENEKTEITDTSGTIRTIREGAEHYDNSMHCTWVIRGLNPTDNVFINVTSSNLAWAPETAICNSHDYVEVKTSKWQHINIYLLAFLTFDTLYFNVLFILCFVC